MPSNGLNRQYALDENHPDWFGRLAGDDEFHAAKRFGLLACGLAVVLWFGLFMVFGGAGFQMWQTEAGGGALRGAFSYAVMSALILVIVQQKEK